MEYDLDNRLTKVTISNTDNWSFEYTDSDDIEQVQHGGEVFDYQYHPDTNRLQNITSNLPNRNRHFQTDDRGNIFNLEIIEGETNSRMSRALNFNAADQVVSVNNSIYTTHYSYDGKGATCKES